MKRLLQLKTKPFDLNADHLRFFPFLCRLLLTITCVLAALTLILEHGFAFSPQVEAWFHWMEIEIAGIFVFLTIVDVFASDSLLEGLRIHSIELLLVVALLAEFVYFFYHTPGQSWSKIHSIFLIKIYFLSLQAYIFYSLIARMLQAGQHLLVLSLSPAVTVLLSFLFLILAGALALCLPTATYGTVKPNISFLDALFTSTSAVCVTGLIVVDTATVYSRFGQTIIMMLIQFGALGIMTYVGIFSFMLGQNYSLRGRFVLYDMINIADMHRVTSLLKVIIVTMLGCETIGAILLYFGLFNPALSVWDNVFTAIFHSISAFGNAGFSTYSNNLEGFANSPLVLLTIGGLIILGGLGFAVIYDVVVWLWSRLPFVSFRHSLSIHTRLVLRMTGVMIFVGMVAVLLSVNYEGIGWQQTLLTGLFQSVTTRTAGFNTIPLLSIAPWALLILIMLMFIGAAPGGTAGGIKVSTVGLLIYSCRSLMKGRSQVEIMKRSIPEQCVQTAFVLCGLAISYVALAVIAMLWAEPNLPFMSLLFEVVSAFGTVGLSLGVTAQLSAMGKIILIITMCVGRVGPLTVFLAMARRRDDALYRYPTGTIAVG